MALEPIDNSKLGVVASLSEARRPTDGSYLLWIVSWRLIKAVCGTSYLRGAEAYARGIFCHP